MVVQIGEPQILERKMPQAVDGGVGRKLAPADLVEEFADGVGVQGKLSDSRLAFGFSSAGLWPEAPRASRPRLGGRDAHRTAAGTVALLVDLIW